jgi:hypothetical protein
MKTLFWVYVFSFFSISVSLVYSEDEGAPCEKTADCENNRPDCGYYRCVQGFCRWYDFGKCSDESDSTECGRSSGLGEVRMHKLQETVFHEEDNRQVIGLHSKEGG